MSFSSNVKAELLTVKNAECCSLAEAYGLLIAARSFSPDSISILTENTGVAEAFLSSYKLLSGTRPKAEITSAGNNKISADNRKLNMSVLEKFGYHSTGFKRRVNFANFQNSCCFAAFIRGVFLACGTVTDPEKEYHLEFSLPTKGLSEDMLKIFDEFEPVPKCTVRSGAYIVYFKSSGDIEDVLAIMGATEKSLELMGAKMYKDVRNTVNRKVNFENANIARTILAAARQYEAIELIKEKKGFERLPEPLRETAVLRYENRELSNAEIAALLPEDISVSGINHRFQKLIKIAEDLKK